MPELYSRAVKKWERNYGGLAPTLDFSNGVRVRDIAIDTSTSPYTTWKCRDNTIGAPVWVKEDDVWRDFIPDNDVTPVVIGKTAASKQFVVTYVMVGGDIHQSGVIVITHDGVSAQAEHEYGGINPSHDIEVSGDISSGNVRMVFDTRGGVGTNLDIGYNILSKIPTV